MINLEIGIIGNGFVGNAHFESFSKNFKDSTVVYDIDPVKSTATFRETVSKDIVFVCLPTPMFKDSNECDLSYIENFFKDVNDLVINTESVKDTVFVIKSTVPVGTTERLNGIYENIKILHSPEFLTASNAHLDFMNPSRNIVGGCPENGIALVSNFYKSKFPDTLCLTMNSNSSEFVKYFANTFFATKVSFFNEMYLLSDKLDLDWDCVVDGVMSDTRIGRSHHKVPGLDGDFGFGGTCFPKDINAFIKLFESYDIDPMVLKSVWKRNLTVRKNKDWESSKSAVSISNKK
jgi:nucleotide sugar dehydrogenase